MDLHYQILHDRHGDLPRSGRMLRNSLVLLFVCVFDGWIRAYKTFPGTGRAVYPYWRSTKCPTFWLFSFFFQFFHPHFPLAWPSFYTPKGTTDGFQAKEVIWIRTGRWMR